MIGTLGPRLIFAFRSTFPGGGWQLQCYPRCMPIALSSRRLVHGAVMSLSEDMLQIHVNLTMTPSKGTMVLPCFCAASELVKDRAKKWGE